METNLFTFKENILLRVEWHDVNMKVISTFMHLIPILNRKVVLILCTLGPLRIYDDDDLKMIDDGNHCEPRHLHEFLFRYIGTPSPQTLKKLIHTS